MNVFIIAVGCAASAAIIAIVVQRQSQVAKRDIPERLEQLITLQVPSQVAGYLAKGERLNAVKAYRNETGLGLREATSYVDQMMKQIS